MQAQPRDIISLSAWTHTCIVPLPAMSHFPFPSSLATNQPPAHPVQSDKFHLNKFQYGSVHYGNSGFPFLLCECHISCGVKTHARTHTAVSINTRRQLTTVHTSQLRTKTCSCMSAERRMQTQKKQTGINTHTQTHTLSLHCEHNSQAWLCASLIPLTVSEKHVNQRRGCQLSHIRLYLSFSHSLCLRLSASICIYSLQSAFARVKALPHCVYLAFLFSSCSCSSSHPITTNHVLSSCSYILMHLPPCVRRQGRFETLKTGWFI